MKKFMAFVLEAISKPQVQDKLIAFLKTKVVENFIVSVLSLSGFKAWFIRLLADRIIDEADEHLIEPIFREVGFVSDQLKGAIIYKKVRDAKALDEWLSAVRDV